MWNKYADGGKGLVIEFDGNHEYFKNRQRNSNYVDKGITPVMYSLDKDRPEIECLEINKWDGCFQKGKNWAYEQEHRMIKLISKADKTIKGLDNIYLFNLPPLCIKGIIFGYKMLDTKKLEIVKFLKNNSKYKHITLFQAYLDSKGKVQRSVYN